LIGVPELSRDALDFCRSRVEPAEVDADVDSIEQLVAKKEEAQVSA